MSQPLKVITGLSGSGITTAIDALEDLGYFCIDNLPAPLLPKLLDLADASPRFEKLAIGLDARNVNDAQAVLEMLAGAAQSGFEVDMIFLEASDAALLRRFSTSRRTHPLAHHGLPLPEAIRTERERMHPFRERADQLVDTSDLNVHECKRVVQAFATGGHLAGLALAVMSFGFRHGVPTVADIVWDVRFLANPYFIEHLRPYSGLDLKVAEYVLQNPVTGAFLRQFLPLLDTVLPAYEQEGKAYLTVAIGCTGGRHRSVAIAEHVGKHLRAGGHEPKVRHRDVERTAK